MTLDGKDHAIFRTARRLAACRDIARADEHPDAYLSQWENELDAEDGDTEYGEDYEAYCEGV